MWLKKKKEVFHSTILSASYNDPLIQPYPVYFLQCAIIIDDHKDSQGQWVVYAIIYFSKIFLYHSL